MAVFRTVIRSDLQKPLVVQQLSGNMFTADNASNEIAVEVTNGGEPVALSGAVTAYAVRSDGATAMFSGTISGNVASVILPATCYTQVGTLSIVIKVGATTVGACTCYVYRTTTDEIIDPGHVIPSIADLLAQIEAAVATIPASWAGLMADIAPTYSDAAVYPVGAYVYYNGDLYRCTTAITTAESWTAGHWTQAALGNDVTDLKSAFNDVVNSEIVNPDNLLNPQNVTSGYYWTDGWHASSSYDNTGYIPVESGETYYLWTNADTGIFRKAKMRFVVGYDSTKTYVSSSEKSDVNSYTVPSGVSYIIISAVPNYFVSHGMVTTNGTDAEYSEYFEPYTSYEINMDYVNAYTKEEIDALKFPELFLELEISPSENLYNKATSTDGYISANGSVFSSDTYCYSAKIPVKVGETYYFWALYNGKIISATARFLCAYDSENNPVSLAGSNSAISNYTVPDGISAIVISFEQNRRELFIVTDNSTQPDELLPYNIEHYIAKGSFIQKAFSNLIRGDEFLRMEVATATASQEYDLVDHIDNKKNCAYSFFGRFSAFTSLQIGHGKTESGACYMIIDGTNLTTYNSSGAVYTQTPHGLAMSDFISVSIKEADTKTARASVEIITNGGSVLLTNIIFFGCNGKVHFICGQVTTDVKFVYNIMDLRKDVYVFGDSYISLADDKRWPNYAISNEDNNMLLSGFPGARAEEEYPSFEKILSMGTPKYLCWFLGMNNPDGSTVINSNWVTITSQVLSTCRTKGIIPILATIPNTPTQRNTYKNAWVKASGERYVDFAKAVGAESAGSTWYPGMLSSDNVHPTAEGAKALWLRLRMDVPEIMQPTTT